MPDDYTIGAANANPVLPGEAEAMNDTTGRTRRPNPYVQVALTYVRRPFSSRLAGLVSAVFVGLFAAIPTLGSLGKLSDAFLPQLMLFFSLFVFLAIHAKGQFVSARPHLVPGFRRVHAMVAALAAFLAAVVLPALIACLTGWSPFGSVAVAVLLFGTIVWVIVKDATWTLYAILLGWTVLCMGQWGPAYVKTLVSGQLPWHAAVVLAAGILLTLVAGLFLVRLKEETLTYDSTLRVDWDWSQKTRQGWNGDGRILPGLRDWIRERQMTRLARLARRAPASRWARICRWQVGMAAGASLWLWILGGLIYVQVLNWWIAARAPKPGAAMMELTSLVLTFVPALSAIKGVFQWRTFKLRHESLLPVERKDYIRQLGTAAAWSHFQCWAGMSAVLTLWWLLLGPRPLFLASLAGVLAFSAAIQVAVFGIAVWIARHRSHVRTVLVVFSLVLGTQLPLHMSWVRCWALNGPQALAGLLWFAGILALLGLLLTRDAYRRWLVTELD